MKIAILTSPDQWFIKYSEILKKKIENSQLFFDHRKIGKEYDIVFILSYHNLIEKKYLKLHKHNIVVHASALPQGKGWSPMFWQILEGKNEIPFTMFEASTGVDSGDIYMQKILKLSGYELNKELRDKQANMVIDMCLEFVKNYEKYKIAIPQNGEESFYSKRNKEDSELDINKTIKDQFNLLRIVDNEHYPGFFYIGDKKYIIKIEEDNSESRKV
ncbi:MAG: methionyl-tRNA formyltransferase [Sulfurospirillum sp.]|nr:MAG: methionyl-tRNA formyltransferase [Sulfurospirillum sp.]